MLTLTSSPIIGNAATSPRILGVALITVALQTNLIRMILIIINNGKKANAFIRAVETDGF